MENWSNQNFENYHSSIFSSRTCLKSWMNSQLPPLWYIQQTLWIHWLHRVDTNMSMHTEAPLPHCLPVCDNPPSPPCSWGLCLPEHTKVPQLPRVGSTNSPPCQSSSSESPSQTWTKEAIGHNEKQMNTCRNNWFSVNQTEGSITSCCTMLVPIPWPAHFCCTPVFSVGSSPAVLLCIGTVGTPLWLGQGQRCHA